GLGDQLEKCLGRGRHEGGDGGRIRRGFNRKMMIRERRPEHSGNDAGWMVVEELLRLDDGARLGVGIGQLDKNSAQRRQRVLATKLLELGKSALGVAADVLLPG